VSAKKPKSLSKNPLNRLFVVIAAEEQKALLVSAASGEDAINRYLKEYCGLSKEEMDEASREGIETRDLNDLISDTQRSGVAEIVSW